MFMYLMNKELLLSPKTEMILHLEAQYMTAQFTWLPIKYAPAKFQFN